MPTELSRGKSPSGPDFVALYEPRFKSGGNLTPRMAYWLWSASLFLADTFRLNRDRPELLLLELPPIARPFAKPEWLDRFCACFQHLGERVAAGDGDQGSLASCTAEELALHLVIDLAEGFLRDGVTGPDTDEVSALPEHGDADSDFESMRELLFEDHDVLMLFNPSLDGIEDAQSDLDQFARPVNLHPRDWFKPFSD